MKKLMNKKSSIKIVIAFILVLVVVYFISSGAISGKDKTQSLINKNDENLCDKHGISLLENCFENSQNILSDKDYKSVEEFCKTNDLNCGLINAIIEVESKGDTNAFRFECKIFNENSDINVPCTGKYGTLEETNKNAFNTAQDINGDIAIHSSSIGLFQVVGREMEGHMSYDEYFEKSNDIKGQIEIFGIFLNKREKNKLLTELRKENPDFHKVALYYNGGNYEYNDQHTKLKNAYENQLT